MDTFALALGIAVCTVSLWMISTVGGEFVIFMKCIIAGVLLLFGLNLIIISRSNPGGLNAE